MLTEEKSQPYRLTEEISQPNLTQVSHAESTQKEIDWNGDGGGICLQYVINTHKELHTPDTHTLSSTPSRKMAPQRAQQHASGHVLVAVALLVTALAAPATGQTWNGRGFTNIVNKPSGGWTTCPEPVSTHLPEVVAWKPSSVSATEADAIDSAATGTVNYYARASESDFTFHTVSKGLYMGCQTDADCVKICADFKCKTAGASKRCEVEGADANTPDAATVAAKARCHSNTTVFKDMTMTKFKEVCAPPTPPAVTTCPDAIAKELKYIKQWMDPAACNSDGIRIGAENNYEVEYGYSFSGSWPNCNDHTFHLGKWPRGLYASCTTDAECSSICDARCNKGGPDGDRCEPNFAPPGSSNCAINSYHKGLSPAKLKELCVPGSSGSGSGSDSSSGSGSDATSSAASARLHAPACTFKFVLATFIVLSQTF